MNATKTALLAAGVTLAGVLGGKDSDTGGHRPVGPSPDPHPVTLPDDVGAQADLNGLVEQYCVRCHNERRLRGDLSLEDFDAGTPEENAEVAERMIHKLRAGMMPPAGVRRPPEDSLSFLAASLEDRLDEVARQNPDPGRRTFQRLNRAEYEASIEQIFGIRIDASAFLPTEQISDNFDNIADAQGLLVVGPRGLPERCRSK